MTLPRGLYAITPESLARVEAALASGALCALQYRAKHAGPAQRLEEAAQLAGLCRAYGVALIVNDDLELALEVDAAGVHLGRDDGDLADARAKLPGRLLGVSCYDRPEQAEPLCRRALGIFEASLGPEHPHGRDRHRSSSRDQPRRGGPVAGDEPGRRRNQNVYRHEHQ